MPDDQVSLLEFIQKLRDDIEESQHQLQEAGKEPMFKIDKVDVEAHFVLRKELGGKAGVQFYFVTLGAEGKYGTEEVHTIKLSFSPIREVLEAAGGKSGPPPG